MNILNEDYCELFYGDDNKKDSSKRSKKKKLSEGAGAGYTIKSELYITRTDNLSVRKGWANEEGTFTVTGDIEADILDFSAYSYMYGSNLEELRDLGFVGESCKAQINEIIMDSDGHDLDNIDIEDIKDELLHLTIHTKSVYGAGWSHSTWDGTICDTDDYVEHNDNYGYDNVIAINATVIDDGDFVSVIDDAVQGNLDEYDEEYIAESADGETNIEDELKKVFEDNGFDIVGEGKTIITGAKHYQIETDRYNITSNDDWNKAIPELERTIMDDFKKFDREYDGVNYFVTYNFGVNTDGKICAAVDLHKFNNR